jgi:hypothetical protein
LPDLAPDSARQEETAMLDDGQERALDRLTLHGLETLLAHLERRRPGKLRDLPYGRARVRRALAESGATLATALAASGAGEPPPDPEPMDEAELLEELRRGGAEMEAALLQGAAEIEATLRRGDAELLEALGPRSCLPDPRHFAHQIGRIKTRRISESCAKHGTGR